MTVGSVFERTLRWMISTPLVWLYGLLAAVLGWSNLSVTLISTAMRAPDEMIGRGAAGAGLLAAFLLVALLLFALTFGLDVLKGPIATLFGLLTNGWADTLALLVGPFRRAADWSGHMAGQHCIILRLDAHHRVQGAAVDGVLSARGGACGERDDGE